jgi:hypothetical protein
MKLTDLKLLFVLVAVVEAFYGVAGIFTPPSMVGTVLGWNLSADGQWVTKLLGLALASQAAIAWALRRNPSPEVAWIFALYQVGAATADWVLWLLLADQGLFANRMAQLSVMAAIPTHYALGLLLIIGAVRAGRESRPVVGREVRHA